MAIFGTKKEDDVKANDAVKEEKKNVDKKTDADISSLAAAHHVIISPIVTEKSHALTQENKYTFRVVKSATKAQIKRIIENVYKVTVENVHMISVAPKRRTVKYDRGYQSAYKKAIVRVKKGDHITLFEGA